MNECGEAGTEQGDKGSRNALLATALVRQACDHTRVDLVMAEDAPAQSLVSAPRMRQIFANHLDDFERHLQGIEFVLGRHHPRGLMGDAVEQMFDLELEGIVLMDEDPLDQGFLLIAQLATPETMFGGTLPEDANILVGVIEQDVFFALGHRQGPNLLLRGAAGGDGGQTAVVEPELDVGDILDIGQHCGTHGTDAMRTCSPRD